VNIFTFLFAFLQIFTDMQSVTQQYVKMCKAIAVTQLASYIDTKDKLEGN